jgi:voltage-gated potassium channel
MDKFIAMLEKIANKPRYLAGVFVSVVVVSSILYSMTENKNFFDGLWWTFVTGFTVGYGDLYPETLAGRIGAVMLMIIIILVIVPVITAQLASKLIVDRDKWSHEEQEALFQALENDAAEQQATRAAVVELTAVMQSVSEQLACIYGEVDSVEELAATSNGNDAEVKQVLRLITDRLGIPFPETSASDR